MTTEWSDWSLFPDPRKLQWLRAPFGPGCYELRNGAQLVLYGKGSHVAERLTSLLPAPFGCGTRNLRDKREYVFHHLGAIEYRTLACSTPEEAAACERQLKANRAAYIFQA